MSFIHEDFMLKSKTGKKLYHEVAEKLPIIDYHCHLPPQMIAENHRFRNATDLFLGIDHYKWRLMRTNGYDERYMTGDADDYDKWLAFANTLPLAIGNPMYHWTHLELKRYFGVDIELNGNTAKEIWDQVNACLAQEEFFARGLITRSGVELVCTTDFPGDSLEYHERLKDDFPVRVLPTFRPNLKGLDRDWIVREIDRFAAHGCRLSDHAVDEIDEEVLGNLVFLGKEYAKRGWTMQIHLGTIRNNNTKMHERLGVDMGFDSVSDMEYARSLAKVLDAMEQEDLLPKIILYNLNPRDNFIIATLMGAFQKGPTPGKIQFGSAWWFSDQRDGLEKHFRDFANLSLLPRFVGMTTDSRSFVSYPRHEYFRRLFCNLIGQWVDDGEYPENYEMLKEIVTRVCYQNAKEYFGF